ETGEFLGINADDVGSAEIVDMEGDIATMMLTRVTQEARIGDRLFASEERAVNSSFMPSEPEEEINGLILDVPRGVTQIGQFDVVTLNKGARDGLKDGNVLAVYKTGETVRDRVTGENVKIPDERAGLLMVFRTYEKLSYGLVLQATRSLAVQDKVRNPRFTSPASAGLFVTEVLQGCGTLDKDVICLPFPPPSSKRGCACICCQSSGHAACTSCSVPSPMPLPRSAP